MLLFYIKMFLIKIFLKHSSAKYYQKSKEKLQEKLLKGIKVLTKRRKTKSNNAVKKWYSNLTEYKKC